MGGGEHSVYLLCRLYQMSSSFSCPFLVNFCVLFDSIHLHSFACGNSVSPALFVEKSILSRTESSWYLCWKLSGIDVLFCFGALNSVHKSMSICCYACTKLFRLLYLNFETKKYVASNLLFFSNLFWLFWATSNYMSLRSDFSISAKKAVGTFRDCIEL